MSSSSLEEKFGLEPVDENDLQELGQPLEEPENVITAEDLETGQQAEGSQESAELGDKPEEGVTEGDTISKTFEEMFAEKYGEDFEVVKKEEYSSLKEKAEKERLEDLFNPESLDLLKNVASSGLDWNKIKDIADIQTLDVESLSPLESIAKSLQIKEGLTQEEINLELREFKKLEKVDLEDLDEDEKDEFYAKKARLGRLEREAKKFLDSQKDSEDYKLPSFAKQQQASEEALKQQQDEFEKLKGQYESEVSEFLKEKSSLSLDLGEENKFDFNLTEDQKAEVHKAMNNINSLHTLFITDKGVDYQKMMNFIAGGLFSTDLVKSSYNSATNKGEENAVKNMNNVTLGNKGKSGKSGTEGSLLQQLVQFNNK
jgi:hypothetical protein